jgi:hypothetical protein
MKPDSEIERDAEAAKLRRLAGVSPERAYQVPGFCLIRGLAALGSLPIT